MEPTTALETEAQDFVSTPRAESNTAVPALLVEEDLLVEEISIDGMCGVY